MSKALVHLTSGMVVPVGAYLAGHRWWVEGGQIVVRTTWERARTRP